MNSFDRDFHTMRRAVFGWFTFAAALIIAAVCFNIYIIHLVMTAVSDNCQDGLAKCAGRVVGDFQKGMNGEDQSN